MVFSNKPAVKRIVIPVLVVVVLSGVFFAYRALSGNKSGPTTSQIDYKVRKGNIQSAISAIGTIYSSNSQDITAPGGSTVLSVNCSEGQAVKSGDLLFTLKNDSANLDLKKAKLNLSQLQNQLNTLKSQQGELTMYSPSSGIVTGVNVTAGDDVNRQDIVASIEDRSAMVFSISSSSGGINSQLISSLKVNDSVRIFIQEINAERAAVVTSVTPDSRGGGAYVGFRLSDKSGLAFDNYYNLTFKLPSADVQLNTPVQLTGSITSITAKQSGTVSIVYIKTGDTVSKGKKIVETTSDNITNQIQTAEVNIESAQLDVENKQEIVDGLNVKAPFDGMVFNIQVKTGDAVGSVSSSSAASRTTGTTGTTGTSGSSNSSGNVLASLENKSSLQVRIPVDELDIGKVQVGQSVEITADAFKDKVYKGKVSTIAPQGVVQNGVATFEVVVDIDSPDGLKTGMTANVSIITACRENALLLPLEAIADRGGKKYVLVNNGGTISQKEVTLGVVNTDFAEIAGGLSEGDTIVIQTTTSTGTNSNNKSGFPGMGGFSGMGGNGGSRGNWGGGQRNND
jgi:HlyD family secretion protein